MSIRTLLRSLSAQVAEMKALEQGRVCSPYRAAVTLTDEIAKMVSDPKEKKMLRAFPMQAFDRLTRVALVERVPREKVLQEIRGAKTARNVLIDSYTGNILPA